VEHPLIETGIGRELELVQGWLEEPHKLQDLR
jgi:hypothetical protein